MRLRLTPLIAALAFALVPTASAAGIAPRIVGPGDTTSPPGAHPYMAALVVPGFAHDNDGTFCGATVIAPYAFLTAAHCIIQDQPAPHTLGPADLIVATGRTDLFVPGGQRLAVRKIVTHPDFGTPFALANDVAVVFTIAPTTSAAVARDTVTPAEGETGTALGWGATDVSPAPPTTFPAQLQEAALPILAADTCTDPGVVCAGSTSPNICIGDSGGPLLVTRAGVTRQAGIASAILTGSATTPVCGIDSSEFVDVSLYNSWIDGQLVPAVSGVTVSAAGGILHVTWQRIPGGAEPAVAVATTDGTIHSAAPGATSLDITGLPLGVALGATVSVTNAWGTASATGSGYRHARRRRAGHHRARGQRREEAHRPRRDGRVRQHRQGAVRPRHGAPHHDGRDQPAGRARRGDRDDPVRHAGRGPHLSRTDDRAEHRRHDGLRLDHVHHPVDAPRPHRQAQDQRVAARRQDAHLCARHLEGRAGADVHVRVADRRKLSRTQKKSKLKLTTALAGKSVSCVVTAKNPAAAVTVRSAAVTVRRR